MSKDFESAKQIIEFAENVVGFADFKLLRTQERELVAMREGPIHNHLTDVQLETLDGILNFLDGFQDDIIDYGLASEEEVFGPYCEQCGSNVEPEDYDFNKKMCKKCAQEKP